MVAVVKRRFVPVAIGVLAAVLTMSLLVLPVARARYLVLRVSASVHREGSAVADPAPARVAVTAGDQPRHGLDLLHSASWNNPCGLIRHPLRIRHVVWIWFENQNPRHALGGPATSLLAANCGTAGNYFGLTHPSLPNYLAAVSGSTGGIRKDCFCTVPGPSLMSQVSTWRVYAQSMPQNCDPTDHLPYEAHHNFALHFETIDCDVNDVPLSRLRPDLNAGHLPEFSFILPDTCHNMHFAKSGCHRRLTRKLAVRSANIWLQHLLTPILGDRTYRSGHMAIFIAWDEGEPVTHKGEHCLRTLSLDCQTSVIVVAPSVVPGTIATKQYSPYSLLRTAERLLGIPLLRGARSAHGMRAAFNL